VVVSFYLQIKNKALQSRISDLEEQNALFVEIMEQLEQEQVCIVLHLVFKPILLGCQEALLV
jgi:hypothetical protein